MSFQDRQYQQNPYQGSGQRGGFGGGLTFGMPRPTPIVKNLLIINIVVFVIKMVSGETFESLFHAIAHPPVVALQLWRLVTFQFLHANVIHLFCNMLGLYFLGTTLERSWGSRRFLVFYLVSGAVGGATYVIASLFGAFSNVPLVGASGGVLAVLVACAILFPQIKLILVLFPVPIRFAALLFTGLYVMNVLQGGWNAGGDVCHLGGMATGFVWVYWGSRFTGAGQRWRQASGQRRERNEQLQDYDIDRILAKVHEHGIHSLTSREKATLRRATEDRKHQSR